MLKKAARSGSEPKSMNAKAPIHRARSLRLFFGIITPIGIAAAVLGIYVGLRVLFVAIQDGIELQSWDPAFYVLVPARMRELKIPQERPGREYSSRVGEGNGEGYICLSTVSSAKSQEIIDAIESVYIGRGASFTRELDDGGFAGTVRHYRFGRLRVEICVAAKTPAREVVVYEYEVKHGNY